MVSILEKENMSKDVSKMTNEELLKAWKDGYGWLIKNEQVSKTGKNAQGGKFDQNLYLLGLERIEEIEIELQKRGLSDG